MPTVSTSSGSRQTDRLTQIRPLWAAIAAVLALAAIPAPAAAQLQAAVAGQVAPAVEGAPGGVSEEVLFNSGLVPALLGAHLGRPVRVTSWPVAPGVREEVDLTRFDVYAPDAKIFGFRNGRPFEVGRSRLVFFKGRAVGAVRRELLVTIDPDTRELSGFAESPEGRSELRRLAHAGGSRYRVAEPDQSLTAAERAEQAAASCGQEQLPAPPRSLFEALAEPASGGQAGAPLLSLGEAAITSLHQAVIAVDTDNEFFYRKWGVKTTSQYQANATNYLASLIAAMTVIYERDFMVRLVQGTTYLRTPPVNAESNFATDPYNQAGSPAKSAQLTEFGDYWKAGCQGTCTGVARALAMMISGKSGGGGSGIAWVGTLCSANYGYSFNQIFINTSTIATASEGRLVGHELGHNFGSPHTHCYSPPVDGCYNANGCYSGAPSCPASTTINGVAKVTGTIMSYCHHLGGCTASSVFHPASVSLLQSKIQNAVNQCIFPVAGAAPMAVSAVTPASGPSTGGTVVTISGSGFVAGGSLAVSVGGAAATNVVRQSATTLTAIAPAHAAATVDIKVTNGSGAAQTLASSYTYAPPAVASGFYTLVPCRVLDTRNPNGPTGGPALAPAVDRVFSVTACGVPADAMAISANLTAINPAGSGAVSVFPGNANHSGTGEISFRAKVSRANNAILPLATDASGTIKVRNLAALPVDFALDVNGYFR